MTKREIMVGIGMAVCSPLLVAMVVWLFQQNTHDTEYQQGDEVIVQQLQKSMAPLEFRARQEARREIRVLSEKIRDLDARPDIAPEEKDELEQVYLKQLDMAQSEFDAYDDD